MTPEEQFEAYLIKSFGITWEREGTMEAFGKALAAERQRFEMSQVPLLQTQQVLVDALKLNMEWIGPPPTGKYDYDSLREDAWVAGKAALAKVKNEARAHFH